MVRAHFEPVDEDVGDSREVWFFAVEVEPGGQERQGEPAEQKWPPEEADQQEGQAVVARDGAAEVVKGLLVGAQDAPDGLGERQLDA